MPKFCPIARAVSAKMARRLLRYNAIQRLNRLDKSIQPPQRANIWQILASYAYSLESVPGQRSLLTLSASASLLSATAIAQ